jgi:hypothetical protein
MVSENANLYCESLSVGLRKRSKETDKSMKKKAGKKETSKGSSCCGPAPKSQGQKGKK